ncbi:hypothetical protein [Streptomyces sp. NPDC057580]|uniref:hypothetical protein n=1 Tax=Streptomyces sp. NPDC057580 TaxID=3346173 RepID=UPI00368D0976
MAARTSTARKRTTARRRKPVSRARVGKGLTVPRDVPLFARLGMRIALMAAKEMEAHKSVVMSRKDAAILRYTHEGCPTCKGNGQIFTKGKDGSFTGSKPCPAKPTKGKAGRVKVAMAARFGPDRNTGLVGWTCPCGKKEKPRFRDAREATKALRAHEKQKHGGKTVGGAWYGQAIATSEESKVVSQKQPVSKVDTHTNMTDAEWENQNSPLSPKAAEAKGLCYCCGGQGALYSAFGGERTTTVCPICRGSGKPAATASTS